MRWAYRLESGVTKETRLAGLRYFRQHRALIEIGGKDEVSGSVTGSNAYHVEIRREPHSDGENVIAFCECPHSLLGNICKHIWTMVLEAESKGYLTRIATVWNPRIRHELLYEAEPHSDETRESGRQRIKKEAPPDWQRHLSALRRLSNHPSGTEQEPPRRVLYLVDVAECLSGGAFVLRAVVSRLKKSGEWGRPNFQEGYIREVSKLDPVDQRILALLGGSVSYGHVGSTMLTSYKLSEPAFDVVLPLVSATERFYIRLPGSPNEMAPLTWDAGSAWLFRIHMRKHDQTGDYAITGSLQRDGEERGLAEPVLLVPGLAFFSDRVSRFDHAGAFEWASLLRKQRQLLIPSSHRNDFIAEIAKFPKLPPIDLPGEFRIEPGILTGPHQMKIRTSPDAWRAQPKLRCEITFVYGAASIPENTAANSIYDKSDDRYFARDRQGEAQAMLRLREFGVVRSATWDRSDWEISTSRFPALVAAIVRDGWRVEADGKLYHRADSFKVTVSSGIDWFELKGSAEFEDQTVELPELLQAIGRGESMIRLGDGSFGLLPEEWLERYGFVASLGKSDDGHVRFSRGQAGLLDALLASQPDVTFDDGFVRVRRELETFAGVQPIDPPKTFNGRLRDYQREGLGWIQFLRRFGFGGCLADDMGLGKTIQVLALLDSEERKGPALVVVPRSLVFNWKQEAARFAPRLRVLDLTGAGRKDRWKEVQEYDLILTTYGTMRRDAPLLKDIRFDTIILDEAQAIKNPTTESAKATRLLNAGHKLALTGTPVENRLSDLWSLFEFLNPGLLGSASVFRNQTAGTVSNDSAQILSKALRPFILRRTKEQVAKELPPKTEQTIFCELETAQRKLYNELREHYRAALLGQIEKLGIQKSRMQILAALLRLRQAACHPGLIDKARASETSAKLESLIPQLQEVIDEGHKALVFSQFTSLLTIVRSRLDAQQITYEYLDGKTRDRESRVRHFQEDPDCRVFLISLKAGGLGLNLTAAEYVFLLDPWWNPATEAQAIDRAHRIGQSQRVFAYRLIARDTIEEKILELQKSKRQLADAIINSDNSVIASLDRKTLELLLS